MIDIRHCIPVGDKPIRNPQQLNTVVKPWNVGTSERWNLGTVEFYGILEACATIITAEVWKCMEMLVLAKPGTCRKPVRCWAVKQVIHGDTWCIRRKERIQNVQQKYQAAKTRPLCIHLFRGCCWIHGDQLRNHNGLEIVDTT
jgi:hypothetical protein